MKLNPVESVPHDEWKTKPSDRFILKWIKINLSARLTPQLMNLQWLRPWMITLLSTTMGVFAGVVFALGCGWIAGFLAAFAQVLDGVDGQFSRLTGMQSRGGAFLDSVLDRYFDAALTIGLVVYLIRVPAGLPLPLLLVMAFFAVSGSSLISYTTARAESLGIPSGKADAGKQGDKDKRDCALRVGELLLAAGAAPWADLSCSASKRRRLQAHFSRSQTLGPSIRLLDDYDRDWCRSWPFSGFPSRSSEICPGCQAAVQATGNRNHEPRSHPHKDRCGRSQSEFG